MKKNSLNSKLDEILTNQKKILKNEQKILGEEAEIKAMEQEELEKEDLNQKTEEEALKELASLEKELKENTSTPLKHVTKRDMVKGFIGAFVGVMGHFAFLKGTDIAASLSFFQISILYLVAFLIIIGMLYYTGFRKIEKTIILKFMPLRAFTLYVVSIVTVFFVNFLFGKIYIGLTFMDIYGIVGANLILAVIGAGTADLIGRNE